MADTITLNFETASAGEIVQAVNNKKVKPSELVEAAIARIERLNPPLNAVVVKDYDRAREAAKAADERQWRGEKGALLGVPMTVKESHRVDGLPTTWGAEDARDWIPAQDSTVIARLKRAGAIIVGKTNAALNLADWMTTNPIYGRTNNPLDLTRTPGGSSGGSAAAVASGMTPIEVGSDIGGSIRIPASFCGIYGLKTTWGLVPAFDHAPARADGAGQNLSVLGPLARTADDLRIVLDVIAGPTGDDAAGYKLALRRPRREALKDFRVLVIAAHPLAKADGEILAALDQFVTHIERAGSKVARASELLPDLAAAHVSYAKTLNTVMSRRAGGASLISGHDWLDLVDEQVRLRRTWRTLFESFDIVLAPIFGTAAFAHIEEPNWGMRTLVIDGQPTPYGAQIAWQGIATFPGLPAAALPIGWTTSPRLPIGIQAIGPFLEDRTCVEFARLATQGRE